MTIPTPETLVASADLQGFEGCAGRGINAEVGLMAQCYGVSFYELMGITGTAFRTHFFVPEMNPGLENAPPWAWSSLRHNNYGHHESAAYFYGGEVISVTDRAAVQNWKVLRFEVDAGRPVIVYGLAPKEALPALVVGYSLHRSPLRQELRIAGGPSIDVTGDALEPAELVLVRQGTKPPYRPSDASRRNDAFRWVIAHVRARKEMVYETSRHYACGASALRASATFLRGASQPDEIEFIGCFLAETLRARNAAITFVAEYLQSGIAHAIAVECAELLSAQERIAAGKVDESAGHLEAAASAQLAWADALEAGLSGTAG